LCHSGDFVGGNGCLILVFPRSHTLAKQQRGGLQKADDKAQNAT
jgi:hypothetical protein